MQHESAIGLFSPLDFEFEFVVIFVPSQVDSEVPEAEHEVDLSACSDQPTHPKDYLSPVVLSDSASSSSRIRSRLRVSRLPAQHRPQPFVYPTRVQVPV